MPHCPQPANAVCCLLGAIMNTNKDNDDGSDHKDRDATALTRTFIACRISLARYIATFFIGREDIEDTVQETYLRTLIAEENTEIQSPKAFLFRVARNIALNRKKRQRRKFEEAVGSVDELIAVDDGPTPFDALYSQEKMRAFCKALDALPPQCRKVFVMQRMQGLSYQEIAERLGCSPRTIEKHLQKALQRCAEHLASNGFYDHQADVHGDAAGNIENFEKHRKRLDKQVRAGKY